MSGPWEKQRLDKYFPFMDIDPSKWDKFFPYILEVVDARNNQVIGSSEKVTAKVDPIDQKNANSYKVNFFQNVWRIVLPISPQQLTITDEFAIANTPTLRGILEEHNGVKYKTISMSGTTGIYPYRQIKQYVNLSSSSFTIESKIGEGLSPNAPLSKISSLSESDLAYDKKKKEEYGQTLDPQQTGYYHALYFSQFLEQYALAKKNPKNNHWRLVLKIAKDNTSYYITPISFSINKNVNRPSEILYSFAARAWKRPDQPNSSYVDFNEQSVLDTAPDFLRSADNFRNKLSLLQNNSLVSSLRNSKEFFDSVRKSVIKTKTLINEVFNIADLPAQVISDAKYAILDAISVGNLIANRSTNSISKAKDAIDFNILKQGTSEFPDFESAIKSSFTNSPDQITPSNRSIKNSLDINPISNIDPVVDYKVLADTLVSSIILNESQQNIVDKEIELISKTGTQDLKDFSNSLRSLSQDIALKLGAGDATTSALYGKPAPKTRAYPLSIEENEFLVALFDLIQQTDNLTKDRSLDKLENTSSPFKFTIDTAAELGINLVDSDAKILMPVPYNLSIEEIAARYLKDRNRWIEIVALNGLREPYIDETGFTRTLLSNGDNRSFTVSSKENLYPGQKISLASSTASVFFRKISEITKLSDTSYLIEVDGEANLDQLKTQDNAYMRAYLPGTVNSQDLIFIPTDLPVDQEEYPTITQTIKQDSLTQLSKVDLLLTDNFDIAIDGNGDFRFSAGMTNLIQALKIKFITEKGSLLAHPDFGIGVSPGTSTADFSATDLFSDIGSMILSDGRFASIKSLTVSMDGPVLSINLQVELRNNLGVVPISFTIPK